MYGVVFSAYLWWQQSEQDKECALHKALLDAKRRYFALYYGTATYTTVERMFQHG
jgi:hypothetical protein